MTVLGGMDEAGTPLARPVTRCHGSRLSTSGNLYLTQELSGDICSLTWVVDNFCDKGDATARLLAIPCICRVLHDP